MDWSQTLQAIESRISDLHVLLNSIVAVYMFILSYVEFRVHCMLRDHQGGRRVMSSADVERGHSMDPLHVKPSYGMDQREPLPRKHDHRKGGDSARRHSRSRRHSHGHEHRSRRDNMTQASPSESSARRHSTSGVRAHEGNHHPSRSNRISLESPDDVQPPRRGISRESRRDSDRLAPRRQVLPPPPDYVNSVRRP